MGDMQGHFTKELYSERLTYTLLDVKNNEDLEFGIDLFNDSGYGVLSPKGYWDKETFAKLAYSIMLTPSDCSGQHINHIPLYTVRIGNNTSGIRIGIINICRRVSNIPVDLGYVIAKQYRQKGYGSEAAKRILEYWTMEFGLKEICLVTAESNTVSQRVAEKIGFVEGGWVSSDGSTLKAYILPGMEKLEGQTFTFWGRGEMFEGLGQ
jgi:hypothetical protein